MMRCRSAPTGIYAAINLSDPLLAGASGLYALSCLTVIAITAGKRHHLRLRHVSTKGVSGMPSNQWGDA
jgi:hypothetical protein